MARARSTAAAALLAAITWPPGARAGVREPLDLTLERTPGPVTLAMRTTAATAPAAPEPDADQDDDAAPAASPDRPRSARLPAAGRRDRAQSSARGSLDERVAFRFNVGFGLDSGTPSGRPLTSGQALDEGGSYDRLRIYGFGDAVIGARGLVVPSLNSYVAAKFRFDHTTRPATPAPSVYDADEVDDLQVRSAYAETDEFFSSGPLKPVFLRAGRQYRYGPAIVHFDGLTAGYDTRALSLTLYGGRRVSLYGFDRIRFAEDRGSVGGFDARVSAAELADIPLVLRLGGIQFDGHAHGELALAYRWSEDVHLGAGARTLDGDGARQSLRLRARISKVSTVHVEIENRTENDLVYDLLLAAPEQGETDPRRYLDLGPPLPRLMANVRAGTVLLDNIDVLVRGGAALEHGEDRASTYAASYIEGGGALEVRVRRRLRVGSSVLARRYDRSAIDGDASGDPDPIAADTGGFGERSFYEGGLNVHYSLGSRQFSAGAELYGRAYAGAPYLGPDDDRDTERAGGRFSVEGWAGKHLRLRAEYDLATAPEELAPELGSLKSLRVMAEGTF